MADGGSLAVVLMSGGLDSCVTAALANEQHRLAACHLQYGQRSEARELKAFHAICDHYGVGPRLVARMPALEQVGGSSLTDRAIPVREGPPEPGVIPSSYVPFRNTHLLAAGVSWAETLGASTVWCGAVWADSSGYPDCREVFFEAFREVVKHGTRPETRIEIVTPLIDLTKAEIVRVAHRLGAPLHLTWSCYHESASVACGRCESCVLRLKGFEEAGLADPLTYATE
ncbi:MAG: 7-cyano-7-deazaguanine synthase QueC [Candidatus Tectimicrobiota bacterium]